MGARARSVHTAIHELVPAHPERGVGGSRPPVRPRALRLGRQGGQSDQRDEGEKLADQFVHASISSIKSHMHRLGGSPAVDFGGQNPPAAAGHTLSVEGARGDFRSRARHGSSANALPTARKGARLHARPCRRSIVDSLRGNDGPSASRRRRRVFPICRENPNEALSRSAEARYTKR